MEALSHLIEAIGHLIGACAWPISLIGVIAFFAPELRAFIKNIGKGQFSLKGPGGLEGTLLLEAAAALGAATGSANAKSSDADGQSTINAQSIAQTIETYVTPDSVMHSRRTTILWVDDRPNNNKFERQSLSLTGAKFILAETTEQALEIVSNQRVDLIISDMQRPPDMKAGFTLLKMLGDKHPPYIIYRSSSIITEDQEAKRLGACGVTNNAERLFELVFEALTSRKDMRGTI